MSTTYFVLLKQEEKLNLNQDCMNNETLIQSFALLDKKWDTGK